MKIFPAVDLLGGGAVRLYQGDYDQVKRYTEDPLEVVKSFESQGARYLHMVDLDAARWKGGSEEVRKNNRDVIARICKSTSLTVEVGGGIRTEEDVKELIDLGVSRLVIGTLLVKKPELAASWAARYDVEFIAGIDARDGEVKIAGWEDGSAVRDEDLAAEVSRMGMRGIIYTNITKDGTFTGPDIDGSVRLAEASGLPVIVSGGMGTMEDCRAVAQASAAHISADGQAMIDGVIIGKALYENRISLEDSITLYQETT